MSSIWVDATGLLFDEVGLIVCDICPCDGGSASVPSCDPDCWNYTLTADTSVCADFPDELPIPCEITVTLSDPPASLCAGEQYTFSATFTNNTGDGIEVCIAGAAATIPGAVLELITCNHDPFVDAPNDSVGCITDTGVDCESPLILANGESITYTFTFEIISLSTPSPPTALAQLNGSFTFIFYDEAGHDNEDQIVSNHYYEYGCGS